MNHNLAKTVALPARRQRRALWSGLVLAVLLVAAIILGIALGAVPVPVETVARILMAKLGPGSVVPDWSTGRENIVWDVRAPRAVLGAIVGAALALVGAALQAVTRNPLADPHLLGISSGAAFGAILVLLHVGLVFGLVTLPLFAFAGALGATAIVLGLTRLTSATGADRMVLVGVAVSFVIAALGNMMIFLGDPRAAHTVVFWMLGGLGLAQWSHLPYPLVALLACGAWLVWRAPALNAMTLGDETATTMGLSAGRFRLTVFVIGAMLTGAVVAFSGVIAFVGLMIPHIVRLWVGGDYRRVLPLSALLGAVFLVGADIMARMLMPPLDMPIGVLTGLVGGLGFIVLMTRKRL